MITFTRTINLLAAVVLLSIPMVSAASGQAADAVAQRLNAKYATLESLSAEFTQTMTSQYSDIRDERSGRLLLRGENYLLDTGDEVYARNGDNVWRYSRPDNQVILSSHMDDGSSFSVNDLFFRYNELFSITDTATESVNGARHHRLVLEPRDQNSFFQEVTLWMRDSDDIVTRVRIEDLNGTVMDFRLTNVELNPALAGNVFAAPADAEVVDLR